jgi:glycosyltransferase involved in cell wall biosynthesis
MSASAPSPMLPRVSVIIANYNYAAYVGEAIASALALDWPELEVIVVDDGSTDGSREVIETFRDRVHTIIYQDNQGQVGACNTGFAASSGERIIFLDADDLLEPSLLKHADRVWRPGVSKVQVRMRAVDAQGRPLGSVFPQFGGTPSAQVLRRWAAAVGTYPTPPGSGNVYARSFLEQIFPLDHAGGAAADSCCIAAAPFLGDVVTIDLPLVRYRVHGRNDGAMSRLDRRRFGREMERFQRVCAFAGGVARTQGTFMPANAWRRSLSVLPYRLASLRLEPAHHPWAGDTRLTLLADLSCALVTPQGMSLPVRLALGLWSLLVLALPNRAAEALILWRFAPGTRPRVLRRSLQLLGVLR